MNNNRSGDSKKERESKTERRSTNSNTMLSGRKPKRKKGGRGHRDTICKSNIKRKGSRTKTLTMTDLKGIVEHFMKDTSCAFTPALYRNLENHMAQQCVYKIHDLVGFTRCSLTRNMCSIKHLNKLIHYKLHQTIVYLTI